MTHEFHMSYTWGHYQARALAELSAETKCMHAQVGGHCKIFALSGCPFRFFLCFELVFHFVVAP